MIPDPIAGLVRLALDDEALNDLVDGRVFGAELPKSEEAVMPRKCVVIRNAGGGTFGTGSRDFIQASHVRFDAQCYGETPMEAAKVRLATYDIFKNMARKVKQEVLIHSINPSSGPLPLRDPDTDWPLEVQTFLALVSEVQVTQEE